MQFSYGIYLTIVILMYLIFFSAGVSKVLINKYEKRLDEEVASSKRNILALSNPEKKQYRITKKLTNATILIVLTLLGISFFISIKVSIPMG